MVFFIRVQWSQILELRKLDKLLESRIFRIILIIDESIFTLGIGNREAPKYIRVTFVFISLSLRFLDCAGDKKRLKDLRVIIGIFNSDFQFII